MAKKSVEPVKAQADGLVVEFAYEKQTPGTYRFREAGEPGNYKIGTLYIKKRAFRGEAPKAIRVLIEPR